MAFDAQSQYYCDPYNVFGEQNPVDISFGVAGTIKIRYRYHGVPFLLERSDTNTISLQIDDADWYGQLRYSILNREYDRLTAGFIPSGHTMDPLNPAETDLLWETMCRALGLGINWVYPNSGCVNRISDDKSDPVIDTDGVFDLIDEIISEEWS